MSFRKRVKRWLYGSCPGFSGSFPYCGTRVYFPKGSVAFEVACAEGIFEWDNVRLLQSLVAPKSWFVDIGANIGLMSAPLLQHSQELRVASFEPSPNSIPSLKRTISESPYRERWKLYPMALGASKGHVSFNLSSPQDGMFDGIKNTGRRQSTSTIQVEQNTLDSVWEDLGRPTVSVIKCDVEGGEMDVLTGASACLAACRPYVLLEWQKQNLEAYKIPRAVLLEFASERGFSVTSVPRLVEVKTARELEIHMAATESFLLSPK